MHMELAVRYSDLFIAGLVVEAIFSNSRLEMSIIVLIIVVMTYWLASMPGRAYFIFPSEYSVCT